jgi:hypothetical protein
MACQPAVQLGVPFAVASDAEAHLKIDPFQSVLLFDIPVARLTIDLIPAHMRLVMEENVIWRKEDSNPGDRFFRIEMFPFLKNLRVLRDDILMAEKTFLHRRKSGALRPFHIRVAETAIDGFAPRMNPVAEKNGLLWPDRPVRISEHVIRHHRKQKS